MFSIHIAVQKVQGSTRFAMQKCSAYDMKKINHRCLLISTADMEYTDESQQVLQTASLTC